MAYNSNLDRQLEDAIGSLIKFIGRTIVALFRGLFRGIKKLNKWITWTGLFLAILVVLGAIKFKDYILALEAPVYIRWLVYAMLLCMPLIYLLIIGGGNSQKKYEKIFGDIGFVGKDGKVPYFCGIQKDGKKKILIFKSNIPLSDWKTAKDRLETALDCTILRIENGKSKKVVKITVLSADFKIQEMITWDDSFCSMVNGIITIGQSALERVTFNLNRVPHALIAGETGSGKSVILRCILWQMIKQSCKVFMIDFKGGVEFGKRYEKYGEVITERERALEVLELLVQENEARLKLFREMEVKNLAEYNRKTKQNLCRIGVFSDEVAEMLDKKGVSKEDRKVYEAIEGKLSTLARLSRATGIHLFLGVQRPDANILPGQIKNNIPVRISGRFADKAASEIVLGNTDAVDLPDIKGRFLYKVGNETIEFQSYFFDDEKMLHDVDVNVGDMLTMPNSGNKRSAAPLAGKTYTTEEPVEKEKRALFKQKQTLKPVKEKDRESKKAKEEPKSSKTIHITPENKSFALDSYEIEVDDSIFDMIPDTQREMEEFDLNLNYWEEEVESE